MRKRTKNFIEQSFEEYYDKNQVVIPPKLEDREWGFILFSKKYPEETVMKRHKSFKNQRDLDSYVKNMVPAHAYFSSAYYNDPSTKKMEKKGWKKADLVFDLDADHLVGVKDLTYQEMLAKVKKEAIKLLEEFLLTDFGISEENTEIVFSGGRGYHIHVREEKTQDLRSPERREIIDYIFGVGAEEMIEKKIIQGREVIKLSGLENRFKKNLSKWIFDNYLKKISKMKKKDAIKELKRYDRVGEELAKRIYNYLKEDKNLQKIKKGHIDIVEGLPTDFWFQLVSKAKQNVRGEADEPVTSDIHRLIRVPRSLHGGSSLVVEPLDRNSIRDFKPLRDAVYFDDEPVKVKGNQSYEVELKEKKFSINKDEVKKLPRYAAIFLSCSGYVEVEGW
ncbi:MAG: Eukaryotic-type DNA primase catalytic small subunit PRI1 [Candidatus Methanohalarchaeum thermophilum]|uniref:DNA primase small subunit PriS n=1 Tax=Methanohalarchaeum thermophilum TaxID=1903181 RepID=A0A1Q6DW55_METT1|nr:MAG: Eukaryotic-type DNA primase catalytic small subunit PRI1 [Candidatus Methanohalarchaeum thermophilum]